MTQAQHANGNDEANILPPFPAFPSASRYVPTGSVDEAMVRIGRSIDAKEAISLVMGPPGTGKSLICQTLTRRYENSHDVIVLSNAGIEDRDSLLRHILHCMGADHMAGPANDLHLSLVDRVNSQKASHGGLLIIVDEAQSLPKEVFEAIRMITNIMQNGQPRVLAILCGGPKLDEVLVDPSMEAFTQRVATRCYLHPFSGDETREYITSVIAQCDADPDRTITLEAISAIHHACSGVPRLINQLMTQSIDVAEDMGQSMMDESVIDRAWAMLQQLPSPMIDQPNMKATNGNAGQAVEYGELSDLDSDESYDSNRSCESKPGSEISVGIPSATWVPEEDQVEVEQVTSEEPIAETAPDTSDLFGEFESEEYVPVGNAAIGMPAAVPVSVAPQQDLESMLHQEIVGMTANDDSVRIFANHSSDDSFVSEKRSDIEVQCEPNDAFDLEIERRLQKVSAAPISATQWSEEETVREEHVVEVCNTEVCDSECKAEINAGEDLVEEEIVKDPNAGALRFVEAADADLDSDPFGMRLVNDDSDLLVIEDELDLQGEQKAPLLEEDQEDVLEPVSVDYQQLMARMRTGT